MRISTSLASQVLRLDLEPEEDGHEQHHPSADVKDGVPDEEAQYPTNDHEEADGKVDVLPNSPSKQHAQDAGDGGVQQEGHEQQQPSADVEDEEADGRLMASPTGLPKSESRKLELMVCAPGGPRAAPAKC